MGRNVKKSISLSDMNNLKSYIIRDLGPKLGLCSGQLDIDILRATDRTVVLCRDGQSSFVVKIYKRFKEFLRTKKNLEYFMKCHLPCPSILHTEVFLRSRVGRFLLVEEEIPGISLREIDSREEALSRIGKTLAVTHSHSGKLWGPPFMNPSFLLKRRCGSHADDLLRSASRRLHKMEQRGRLGKGEAKRLAAKLERARSQIQEHKCHRLIHGDMIPDHFIFLNNKVFMIDLERAIFGHVAWDLVVAEKRLCKSEKEKQVFLSSYFNEAAHTTSDFYERSKPFFEMISDLKHTDSAPSWFSG